MRNIIAATVGLTLVLLSTFANAQCAMCRATVENNFSQGELVVGSGLNMGILYLFLAPYLVIGVVAYFWYRNSKKAGKRPKLNFN